MTGERDLDALLGAMAPQLLMGEFVFTTGAPERGRLLDELAVFATVREPEGLTRVLLRETADAAGLAYPSTFRCITLRVHSSLEAVGLTAAIATRLTEHGISANVIAGFYHDHLFVPADRADEAQALLVSLSAEYRD